MNISSELNTLSLAQKFADYQIPKEIKDLAKMGKQLIGSPSFTKMMLFTNENQLTNDDIDYYMNVPPQRQEGETREDMKMRNKFARELLRYRAQLYDFSTIPTHKESRKQKIQANLLKKHDSVVTAELAEQINQVRRSAQLI